MPDEAEKKRSDLQRMVLDRADQQAREAMKELRDGLSAWCGRHLRVPAWLPETQKRPNWNPTPVMKRLLMSMAAAQDLEHKQVRTIPYELTRIAEATISHQLLAEVERVSEVTCAVLDCEENDSLAGDVPDEIESLKRYRPGLMKLVPIEDGADLLNEKEEDDGQPTE